MPNGCEIPDANLTWLLLEMRPSKFEFMFRIDPDGKCRLAHSDERWAELMAAWKADWTARLLKDLKVLGSYEDYRTAQKVFRIEL